MTDLPDDQSIDDWIAFAHDHDDDGEDDRGSWRHPAVYAAIAIGLASGIEAVGIGMMTGLWFCLTLIVVRILGLSEPEVPPQD